MQPHDVTANPQLVRRFVREIGHLDGVDRLPSELAFLDDVLASEQGARVVAWLWPDWSFPDDFNPFSRIAGQPVEAATWRATLEQRFLVLVRECQYACGVSEDEVFEHLEWDTGLSAFDLNRARHGYFHIEFIGRVLQSLQVEFQNEWAIDRTQLLRSRVGHSRLASQFSDHLRFLTPDQLRSVSRRLPQGQEDPIESRARFEFTAPGPESDYRALYEALARDDRDSVDLHIRDGAVLINDEPFPLPPEALDPMGGWWAGRHADLDTHPQASAWLAAGLEPGFAQRDRAGVSRKGFRQLPGRQDWLSNTHRIEEGSYSFRDRVPFAMSPGAASDDARPAVPAGPQGENERVEIAPRPKKTVPDDIGALIRFLNEAGEATKEQIRVVHLGRGDENPEEARATAKEITNLLTRGRRRGLIVNHGSDTRPRWMAVGSKGDLMMSIADDLGFALPNLGPALEKPRSFVGVAMDAVDEDVQRLSDVMAHQDHSHLDRLCSAAERLLTSLDLLNDAGAEEFVDRMREVRDLAHEYGALREPLRVADT